MTIQSSLRNEFQSPSPKVRRKAVEEIAPKSKLEDYGLLLVGIAKSDKDKSVRDSAASKLETLAYSSMPFNPKIELTSAAQVKFAILEILKPGSMLELEVEKWETFSRWIYAYIVDDESQLIRLAKSDVDAGVRLIAIGKIKDQRILGEIAIQDGDWDVAYTAIEKLGDSEELKKIASCAGDSGFREFVVRRIIDNEWLAEVAKTDAIQNVRLAAVEGITNDEILMDIVLNGYNKLDGEDSIYSEERLSAFRKIQNEEVKSRIIDFGLRTYFGQILFIEFIKDQKRLCEIAKHHENSDLRRHAIGLLTDKKCLEKIAASLTTEYIRQAANRRIDALAATSYNDD